MLARPETMWEFWYLGPNVQGSPVHSTSISYFATFTFVTSRHAAGTVGFVGDDRLG